LGKGFTFEMAYVGTIGRHLMQSRDLTEPVDYVDPGGGGDYYAGGTALSKQVDAHGGKHGFITDANNNIIGSKVNVDKVQYFEDVFPWMANLDYGGESATQAIYNNEWAPYRKSFGATTALSDLDFYGPIDGFYPAPSNWQPHFWQGQFSSLYAQSSIGNSYYNAGQFTLRHPSSHGLQLDVNYTWSHSIDFGSDAERATEFTGGGSFSDIINTWKPKLNKASSDFDTRQLITIDGVYQLPVGRGKALLGGANRLTDSLVGGWQLSGISRTTSGLPWSVNEPGWTTDWQIESYGVVTGNVSAKKFKDQHGDPAYFSNQNNINADVSSGGNAVPGQSGPAGNIRLPYPGEAGQRNNFRGNGYFGIDARLAKTWQLGERVGMQFAWDVFNVTNSVRFDVNPLNSLQNLTTSGSFGVYGATLTTPRVQQLSLRVSF
jgi:hypothetical protein